MDSLIQLQSESADLSRKLGLSALAKSHEKELHFLRKHKSEAIKRYDDHLRFVH